jgi:hypothetical protein
MAAELGGVHWFEENEFNDTIDYPFIVLDEENSLICYTDADGRQLISTLGFIKRLRMTEEEAKELEDDRVDIEKYSLNCSCLGKGIKSLYRSAFDGYQFRLNEDGTEVTLHKKEVK